MDSDGTLPPLPAGSESVPGLGVVTWTSPGDRLNHAEGVLSQHRPRRAGLAYQLLWPLLTVTTTCTHCRGTWPCNRATWAQQALLTQDGPR